MRKAETVPAKQSIDPVELRRAFGTFATGVTIITTLGEDGTPRGMTANSFTSVSLDPPLVLICVGKSASSCEAFEKSGSFAVNILHERQAGVSGVFASKSADKFSNVDYCAVHTGAPVLTDNLSWFDCTVYDKHVAGDHLILVGQVQAFGASPAAPLAFCRGRYAHIQNALPDGWLPSRGMITGYLIEKEGSVLLRSDAEGRLVFPVASKRKPGSRLELADGREIEILPDTAFLYSVFDVADSDPGYLVYRAALAPGFSPQDLPPELQFFPLDDLPDDRVASQELRAVLRRYARERLDHRFGIYVGHPEGGRIAMLEAETPSNSIQP